MKYIFIFLTSSILAGCYGPRVEHIKVNKNDSKSISDSMPVMSKEDIASKSYKLLSPLTATSCKNKAWDASPTIEDAMLQLKIKAKSMDADALINVNCEAPGEQVLILIAGHLLHVMLQQ